VRLLLVDDDAPFRALLRATFELVDVDLVEAPDVPAAEAVLQRRPPDVIVLDVELPGRDGLSLCRQLKSDPHLREIPVVMLTGSSEIGDEARRAGADAFLTKPFSPLRLLAVVERLAGGLYGIPFPQTQADAPEDEQLLLYARDLRYLLEIERGQRALLQEAYRATVSALASALEQKDTGTREHSQRVQRYAIELTWAVEPDLLSDPSAEYGFLLHDVGKIGIPDSVLLKPGPLLANERNLMETHTVLGEQMLAGVSFLAGEGLRVVRSHHERWDGAGYPDRLRGDEIPLGARIFAVADALDAMTSDRPYRPGGTWEEAAREIVHCSERQFDPDVVEAFVERELELRSIQAELATGA
jgi:response regulator RpfG family c-di-GMP phosphodiesterase